MTKIIFIYYIFLKKSIYFYLKYEIWIDDILLIILYHIFYNFLIYIELIELISNLPV